MSNRKNYPIGPSRILTYEEVQKINPRLWEKDWCKNAILTDEIKKRQEESAKRIREYYKRRNAKNNEQATRKTGDNK